MIGNVEAVEKPLFRRKKRTRKNLPVRFSLCLFECCYMRLKSTGAHSWWPRPRPSLPRHVSIIGQLLDVLHHAIELPLPITLGFTAQREAIQALVVPQIAEHRLDRGKAPAIQCPPLIGIDALLHLLGMFQWRRLILGEERHLPGRRSIRVSQALLP